VDVLAEYYKQHPVKHARLYDDAHATLEALRQKGIRTAVASNKPDVLTRHVLDVLGIGGLLDWIIGQSDAFPRKPSPDVLHHLMKLAGADSASTLMIGDSVTDVEFARAAGVKIVGVTYGQCTAGEVERFGPDAIVHSLKELPALFG
jgi:phosphoglycolate phosphatase